MPDIPAGDEVIIIGVEGPELIEEEALVSEALDELGVSEDLGPVGRGAPRYNKHPGIHCVCSPDFKVVTLEVQRTEHVPEGLDVEARVSAADALVCANDANARVFEGREHGGKKPCRGPKDVVIEKNSDLCAHVLQTVCDLDPLVSDSGGFDANVCAWEPLLVRPNNGLCSFSHYTTNGDNDY